MRNIFAITGVIAGLGGGSVGAQPADWHRTTDLDRQFAADREACRKQATSISQPRPFSLLPPGISGNQPTQLRGQSDLSTPLGADFGLTPYGQSQPKPVEIVDGRKFTACMAARGWTRN